MSRPVQPHDGRAGKLGEGVMIASLRPVHEPSLVHGRLEFGSAPPRWRSLVRYGVDVAQTVLARVMTVGRARRRRSGGGPLAGYEPDHGP